MAEPPGDELGFRQNPWGTLTLDGELAAVLVQGGAYKQFSGTPSEAKRIGAAFTDELVGERHGDFKVYRSSTAWSAWFGDVAWDITYVLLDMPRNEIVLMCITRYGLTNRTTPA